jgi:hypothetical protein
MRLNIRNTFSQKIKNDNSYHRWSLRSMLLTIFCISALGTMYLSYSISIISIDQPPQFSLQKYNNDTMFDKQSLLSSCIASNEFCAKNGTKTTTMTMMAVPHTASTTTDDILKARVKSWDASLNLYHTWIPLPIKESVACYNSTELLLQQ